LRHLDTGLIYRAVAQALLDAGAPLTDRERAVAAARALDPQRFDDRVLKRHAIGEAASIVSAIPEVRSALVAMQRDFAAQPPGAVLDGRDIGTVICPDATVKLFITASVEARAARRHKELLDRGVASIYARVLQDMERRDARDSGRAVAPTKPAPDAFVIDTTTLDADGAFAAALAVIRERLGRA
jgi:cytidylate kinase